MYHVYLFIEYTFILKHQNKGLGAGSMRKISSFSHQHTSFIPHRPINTLCPVTWGFSQSMISIEYDI